MSTVSSHRHLPKPLDLEITVISAKHLKNVNWRNGDLNPYVIFWLDPDRRLATKSDDSNSTKPIWNEKFIIPLPTTLSAAVLTLEIFHAKPSDTPKPLVGTLRVLIGELPDLENSNRVRVFDIRRPSGRVNGKIRLKFAIREHPIPDYQNTPQIPYYYSNATAMNYGRIPSSPSPYGSYASLPTEPPAAAPVYVSSQSVPYSVNYNGGYYSQPPPGPPQPSINRQFSYIGGNGGGPSAPMDYGQYDQKPRNVKMGSGSGSGMGGITGGLAGLAIDEGSRYEDRKSVVRVETDTGVKKPEDYIYYRRVDY